MRELLQGASLDLYPSGLEGFVESVEAYVKSNNNLPLLGTVIFLKMVLDFIM